MEWIAANAIDDVCRSAGKDDHDEEDSPKAQAFHLCQHEASLERVRSGLKYSPADRPVHITFQSLDQVPMFAPDLYKDWHCLTDGVSCAPITRVVGAERHLDS